MVRVVATAVGRRVWSVDRPSTDRSTAVAMVVVAVAVAMAAMVAVVALVDELDNAIDPRPVGAGGGARPPRRKHHPLQPHA